MLPDSSTRLNKYISESGICSRREADRYIEQGNVLSMASVRPLAIRSTPAMS